MAIESPDDMTQTEQYAVYLGAVDWRHADWLGSFYPEGLPEDWMLAYYNTQFRAVFIPFQTWCGQSAEDLARWVEDTQPAFRFVLEAPGPGYGVCPVSPELLGARLGLLAARDDPRLLWFDAHTDLIVLADEIGKRDKPLFLFSRDADLESLQRVATLLELMGL